MSLDHILEISHTLDQTIDELAIEQKSINDFLSPLKQWEPTVNTDGEFVMKNLEDGRDYLPTDHALICMGRMAGMSTGVVRSLREPKLHVTKKDRETNEPLELWQRDSRDAEVLRDYINIHMFQHDRLDQDKPRLFRTWDDGTLRAVLSNQYASVNNRWYLQVLKDVVGADAKVLRSRGNADTMYIDIYLGESYNVDTDDGGLGAMLHIGNSEIGERRVIMTPSILRMICTNGLIGWDQIGDAISTVHRRKEGNIDLEKLEVDIRETYTRVVPTFADGMHAMLGLKAYGVGDIPLANVFAQMAIDHHLSKGQVGGVWESWCAEVDVLGPENSKNAYALQNAVTRYGHRLDAKGQYDMDVLGGQLTQQTDVGWTRFLGRASNLDDKNVERRVGKLVSVV